MRFNPDNPFGAEIPDFTTDCPSLQKDPVIHPLDCCGYHATEWVADQLDLHGRVDPKYAKRAAATLRGAAEMLKEQEDSGSSDVLKDIAQTLHSMVADAAGDTPAAGDPPPYGIPAKPGLYLISNGMIVVGQDGRWLRWGPGDSISAVGSALGVMKIVPELEKELNLKASETAMLAVLTKLAGGSIFWDEQAK
jgi:hypothetical protein